MRELYIKAIEKFMPSKRMREYLIKNIDNLEKWQVIEMISGAPADIRDKYEMLKELAECETDLDDEKERCTFRFAKDVAKKVIDEFSLKLGEVFLINEWGCDEDELRHKLYGAEPAFCFDAVIRSIKKEDEYEELTPENIEKATYWYEIEKYIPDENGDLQKANSFMIAPNLEVWFGEYGHIKEKGGDKYFADDMEWPADFYSSQHLNLPVPFEVGDIITIDCRPYAPVKHGVLIEKGDNRDCCCVQCAWVTESGNIDIGALKHASVFDDKYFVELSPLYRAETFAGELPENEKLLKSISDFVHRSEEKGKALWNYIYEQEGHHTGGVTPTQIENYISEISYSDK